ncbi:hypothetical protein [Rothia nasimurium]|uniref:hypothetical protein n=1 Tax=Rothia nasimurium TaxID=85336 RepID=UPI001F43AA87|nr:hypothetical protein [Rothia nasimurium]
MKRIFLSVVVVLVFVLSGCGSVDQKNEAVEPDVNEVFKDMYSAVTVAASANGNEAKFRWMNNTKPFPHKEASWADTIPWSCDDEGKGQIKLNAGTTYDQNLHNEDYQSQVEKVRQAWESRGLKVRNVGESKGMFQIATDLEHGTVVVYTAGVGGESVEADTQCFAGFKGDESSAQVYPGEKA